MIEYDGLIVAYDANTGVYTLTSIAYEMQLGDLEFSEGPAWILTNVPPVCVFYDESDLTTIAELLGALNAELEEVVEIEAAR